VLETIRSRCRSTLGEESAMRIVPSFDAQIIAKRIDETFEALELLRKSLPPEIGGLRDVREPVSLAAKGAQISGQELFRVFESLDAMARMRKYLLPLKTTGPRIWNYGERLPYLLPLAERLQHSIAPDGELLDTASEELRKARTQIRTQQNRITTKLQALISGRLRSCLQDPIFTQRSGRYVIPVKAQFRNRVPGIVHDASASGQTLFIEPQEIIEADDKLRQLESIEREEAQRILAQLSAEVGAHAAEISDGLDAIAEIDVLFAKARHAQDFHCEKPVLVREPCLFLRSAHHPLIDRTASVPITVSVGGKFGSMLITGPNTGGKTVTLKIIGLYALMIGAGIFPPADAVTYGPFAGVRADIGDEQSLQQSLSTFSGHLKNLAHALKTAERGTLVLIDEVGAGTDPKEGAALGRAILEKLADKGAIAAASTHFGELKQFAQSDPRFFCAAMEFDAETLRPTFRLQPGAAGASHALEIALRYGIPSDVIDRAETHMGDEAVSDRKISSELDLALKQAREEREQAAMITRNLEAQERKLQTERDEWKDRLHKSKMQLEEKISNAILETKNRYTELLEHLNSLSEQAAVSDADREEMIKAAQQIQLDLEAVRDELRGGLSAPQELFKVGDHVTLKSSNQFGRVVKIGSNDKITVQVGVMKLQVSADDIRKSEQKQAPPTSTGTRVRIAAKMDAATELHLRHRRAEEAVEMLEKFFDEASLAGLHTVRIIHGKGEGVLKKVVRTFLSKRSDVSSFREGGPGEGGSGATVVYFK